MRVYPIGYEALGARERIDELLALKNVLLIDTRITPYSWRVDYQEVELKKKYKDKYRQAGKYLGNTTRNQGIIRIANPVMGIKGLVMYLREGYDLVLLCKCSQFETCHMREICKLLVATMPEVEVVKLGEEVVL